MVQALQLPQQGTINSLVDWSPLTSLIDKYKNKRDVARAADLAASQLPDDQQPLSRTPLTGLQAAYGPGAVTSAPIAPVQPTMQPQPAQPQPMQPQPTVPVQQQQPMLTPQQRINDAFGVVNGALRPFEQARSPKDDVLDAGLRVIKQKESSGDYANVTTTRNPRTGQPQSALGAYGVMDFNVGPWTKEVLGRELTPREFLADQDAQDAVARAKFGQYASKYGLNGAARAWLAGEGGMNRNVADAFGTTPMAYADDFARKLPAEIATGRSRPDQEVPQRTVNNLVSNQPAAAAGISKDQFKEMFKNPVTRPLAIAYMQKRLDPGTYTFQQIGDTLVRTNSRTGNAEVIMQDTKPVQLDPDKPLAVRDPNAPGGYRLVSPQGASSKEEREVQNWFRAGKQLGMSDDQARAYAANKGKDPGTEALKPTEQKMLDTYEGSVRSGLDVLDNLKEMKELSSKAYEGFGASTRADLEGKIFGSHASEGAVATQRLSNLALQNIVTQLKTLFPGRVLQSEMNVMKQIETLPEQPDKTRQQILSQLEKLIQRRVDEGKATAKAIRDKSYFSPDYQPTYGRDVPDRAAIEAEMRRRQLLQ